MRKYAPLRQFIYDRLYHPKEGYFCRKDFQVGELASPIDFKKLIGYDDYQRELYERYPKNAWLTPSEIFKPYYGMTVANYIKQAHQIHVNKTSKPQPIRIVQAGAGTGSAAESILYYFQNFDPVQLKNIEYKIFEISPTLCSHMDSKLRESFPALFRNRQIQIINRDISAFEANQQSYMLFFQVLDNLPHDRVIWNEKEKKYDRYCVVDLKTQEESYVDIGEDQIIKKCLQMYLQAEKVQQQMKKSKNPLYWISEKIVDYVISRNQKTKDLFLPTFLYQFLTNLKIKVPNSHLIISDFDSFISTVPGINAPIVSCKGEKSEEKNDYDTYLVKRGEADIFFPVNFQFTRYMHKQILKRDAHILKSHEFMNEFSVNNWTQSKSGFNPIKQDFANTSFLTSKI